MEPPADFDQRLSIKKTGVTISEGFALILYKMMELSPDERYQNGGAFLHVARDCHKLDHRYILMNRKQRGIQVAALMSLVMGIVLVFGGMYLSKRYEEVFGNICYIFGNAYIETDDYNNMRNVLSITEQFYS